MNSLAFVFILLSSLTSCQENQSEGTTLEMIESSIITGNQDQRRPVNSFNSSTVAIVKNGSNVTCTGTVIGPRHVLTAAHCLYDKDTDSYKKNITVIPSLNAHLENKKPVKRYFINKIFIHNDYINVIKRNNSSKSEAFKYDIAVVEIKDTTNSPVFSDQTSSIPMRVFDSSSHLGQGLVSLTAYHSDLENYVLYKEANCSIVSTDDNQILKHNCDNATRSSGGSLQVAGSIVALNTGQYETDNNAGTAISIDHIINIQDIMDRYNQSLFKEYNVNQTPYIGLDVINNCDQDIYIAFKYNDLNGDWPFKGHYTIMPGELFITPVKSKSTNIYYHAVTVDRKLSWKGSHTYSDDDGNSVDMRQIQTESYYYDHMININCN